MAHTTSMAPCWLTGWYLDQISALHISEVIRKVSWQKPEFVSYSFKLLIAIEPWRASQIASSWRVLKPSLSFLLLSKTRRRMKQLIFAFEVLLFSLVKLEPKSLILLVLLASCTNDSSCYRTSDICWCSIFAFEPWKRSLSVLVGWTKRRKRRRWSRSKKSQKPDGISGSLPTLLTCKVKKARPLLIHDGRKKIERK